MKRTPVKTGASGRLTQASNAASSGPDSAASTRITGPADSTASTRTSPASTRTSPASTRTSPASTRIGPASTRITGPADSALIRQGRDDDAECIREFVCGLSPQSQYLRFFAAVAPPSSGLLRVLGGGSGADILLVTDDGGAVIAHGMAADTAVPRGLASNIGLVVADRWQQHGLGTLLLSTLIGRALRRGVSSLVLDVLPANDRMLGIIARRWPDAPRTLTRDAIVISPAITPRQAAGGRSVPGLISLDRDRPAGQDGALRAPGPGRAAA